MRAIKFRGKRVDNGEWVYGSLYGAQYQETGKVGIMTAEQAGDVAIIDEVFSRTVGQYTGLKDRNGQEVYEGDILGLYPLALWVVFWQDGGTCGYNNPRPSDIFPLKQSKTEMREVIGNIHENPELLEGK